VIEVQMSPTQVRLFEAGVLIAVHPLLEGRHQRSLLRGHRRLHHSHVESNRPGQAVGLLSAGHQVPRRSLKVYAAIGEQLAQTGRAGASR
jgi:hypothetical protein